MEREADRQAFAKVRSYLNYDPVAKWSALLAAVGTGIVYVLLLFVLWLFADLIVYQGKIPDFADLMPREQEKFLLEEWPAHGVEKRQQMVEAIGVDRAIARSIAGREPDKLSTDDQSLLWRAHLHELLRNRVGDAAAGVVDVDNPERDLADRGVLSLVVRGHVGPLRAVASFLARHNPWMWQTRSDKHANFFYYLSGLLVIALVLAVLRSGLTFVMHEMAGRAATEASTRLRRAVYHHTFRLGTLAIRALGPTEAVTIFTRHVEAIHDALYVWLTVYVREPIKFGLILAFALVVNFWLAVAFLLFALLVWLVGGQVAAYFRRKGRAATSRAAEQLALVRESLMLMRLVKVYLMELFNQSRVERLLNRHASSQMRRYRGEAISQPLLVLLGMAAAIVLLYVAGLVVLNRQLSVASAIALATALVSLYWPLARWLDNRKILRRGREAALQLFKFLGRPGEVGQVVGAEFLPPMTDRLEFDNVSLREPGTNRMLLQDVSLTIKAGERIALVGSDEDGMERHALVYLIPRFLDPSSGEIRIDKHNLRWVTLDSLRAQIALVLQHNLVFHDTVANNIGCGDTAFTLPQIIEAAKMAHAHHFIQKLPKGYETAIGELGHSLSVSEQFRIALARAILRDPALFIIEEPDISLDDDNKALLDDTMARVLPGRTVIFLPHRSSTIKSCDRVFLLHKGRLEAAGVHRELLSQHPLYRHLHYITFSEMAEQA